MIQLFVIADPSYPVDLERVCQQINRLQNRIGTVFVTDKMPPVAQELEKIDLDSRAVRAIGRSGQVSAASARMELAKKPFYRSEEKYILFTNQQLEGNYFVKRNANLILISTYGWEYLTDFPLDLGTVSIMIEQLFRILRRSHESHQDTRGCPFDFCSHKPDINFGLKISRLCSECQSLFDSDPAVNKDDTRALSLVLDHIADCWRRGKSFCDNESSGDASEDHSITKLPFVPTEPSCYFKHDLERVSLLEANFLALDASRQGDSSQDRGKTLEEFVKSLFDCLEGFELVDQDRRLQDCEVDLAYRVDGRVSDLHNMLRPMVLIECKNRREPASVQDIGHHIVRLAHRRLPGGVFVSVGGISGYAPAISALRDSLALIVDEYRQNGRYVLPVVWEDILAVRRGLDMFTMLNNKINEIILQ